MLSSSSQSALGQGAPPAEATRLQSYGNIPPPGLAECPLWTDEALPLVAPVPVRRQLFCNRAINMRDLKAVGFDMDYTLAQYRADNFEALAHKATVDKLITNFGYPEALRSFQFKWDYMMKGLIIDKHRGNMLKVDRHKYVKVATHGFTRLTAHERRGAYNATDAPNSTREALFEEPEYAVVDTLFSLAEAYLYMTLVEYKDQNPDSVPGRKSYASVYKDLRTAVDHCHRDGSLKKAVAADPATFIHPDPLLKEVLLTLRASGRKVFLATNSQWDFTNVVMNYLLSDKMGPAKDLDWLKYFDVVVVACNKPAYFIQRNALFHVDPNTGFLQNTDNGAPTVSIGEQESLPEPIPEPPRQLCSNDDSGGGGHVPLDGRSSSNGSSSSSGDGADPAGRSSAATTSGRALVYQGGYYKDLHSMLGIQDGSQVLYVGDHIYGDILKSKKSIGWRTMLVVPELEFELQMKPQAQDVYQETAVLRLQRDQVSDQIQRLEYNLRAGNVRPELLAQTEATLLRLMNVRQSLKERHSKLLSNLHTAFHPIWGQLMKTGHQNSRFAHQLERFACLYTSHVGNLAFVSPDKSYAGRMDYMAHEDYYQ